jgi:hypothetical protein
MTPLDSETAWALLLGELPEARATALEDELFSSDEAFEALKVFESELVDAYLDGTLAAARRVQFEARPALREKALTAKALRTRAKELPREAPASWLVALFGRRLPFLFATGLAVAGALVLALWPKPMVDAELSLRPLTVRGETAAVRLTLRHVRAVKLELALDGEPARPSWEIVVSHAGKTTWSGAPVKADRLAVNVEVPGAAFSERGRYQVVLRSDGAQVAEYELEIETGD